MPHDRKRSLAPLLKKQSQFWPAIGLLGLRQSGKSTLLRDQLQMGSYTTLDDSDTLDDARTSAKHFLAKLKTPVIIDEVQKAPDLFDAIKLRIDQNKRPGSYFLTGSSQWSSKIGVRESLTGRIGIFYLYPFTLSEAHRVAFEPKRARATHSLLPRFSTDQLTQHASQGALPVPLFTRDEAQRKSYYELWLETSILRDAARVYGKGYDSDQAWSILRQMGRALHEGELPSMKHFKQNSRKLRKYLEAFEMIFLVRKTPCHEAGVGTDIWLPTDPGLVTALSGSTFGEGLSLSVIRVATLNEILAVSEYSGNRLRPTYYKTSRSAPVDLIWGDTAIKISNLAKSQIAYDERPLMAAVKKLGLKRGLLCTRFSEIDLREKSILGQVPWTYWS